MEADVIDTATMQQVGRQMGSNPAGVYQDKSGRRFYVKSWNRPRMRVTRSLRRSSTSWPGRRH